MRLADLQRHNGGMKILVVDDERAVRDSLRRALELEGYEIELACDGREALYRLDTDSQPDAVILDVLMPGLDGLEVCRRIRANGNSVPVLMLTARDAVADKVTGLDAGADDYLTKPFSFDEFLARVRALLRRADGRREPVLRLADLTLDPATRAVTRRARRIDLTAREHALLEYLLRNAGRVLTRPMLAEHVWGLDFDPESNVVDVYVGYLRRKLDGPGEARLLHTVRGVGYVLRSDAD
jgi:two-component system, OmpR family, response regulator MprA